MNNLHAYINKYGMNKALDDFGNYVYTTSNHIVFPNFYCASIIKKWEEGGNIVYSVAMCDWNGYFDWNLLNEYGATDGRFICQDENDIIKACEIIRNYKGCNNV